MVNCLENQKENQYYLIEPKTMKLFKLIIYTIYFILIFNVPICFSQDYIESFIIPNDFEEKSLVLNYNDSLTGVIKITPKNNIFGQYTWLNLYKLKIDKVNTEEWLYSRLHHEIHNIIKVERLIRGPDSPLLDTLFDSARTAIPQIDSTIKKAAQNPKWFCENINNGFNKEGQYFQLYCLYPLGGFKFYLVLRLQKIGNIHYYICSSALNNIRLRKVLEIADSFSLNN